MSNDAGDLSRSQATICTDNDIVAEQGYRCIVFRRIGNTMSFGAHRGAPGNGRWHVTVASELDRKDDPPRVYTLQRDMSRVEAIWYAIALVLENEIQA